MATKGLVLDANILIRAVLGTRVRSLLERYEDVVEFYSPDISYNEARQHLPMILERRGLDSEPAMRVLEGLTSLVQPIEQSLYQPYEMRARSRMVGRDLLDWPVMALALALNLPIWTEDRDFFGGGVATWTTDRIELYLQEK